MSRNLAKLLDQPERAIIKAVNKLEELNGYPSEDARLLAENHQAVRTKIANLGLDPDDTTGEELYQALLVKFAKDSQLIDKALGINRHTTFALRADKAARLLESTSQTPDMWVLKASAAKKLLHEQPPKKLMKKLHYRSVDSMLKRENILEMYLLLPFIESASWTKNLDKRTASLTAANYELRAPQILQLKPRSSEGYRLPDTAVVSSAAVGAIALWPASTKQDASVLNLALMLLDGLEALSPHEVSQSLARVSPTLLWWDQSKSLVARCADETVSMNFRDVAANQLDGRAFRKASAKHGHQSLWDELASRYKNQASEMQKALEAAGDSLAGDFNKLTAIQPPARLAVEYAEAIANEF